MRALVCSDATQRTPCEFVNVGSVFSSQPMRVRQVKPTSKLHTRYYPAFGPCEPEGKEDPLEGTTPFGLAPSMLSRRRVRLPQCKTRVLHPS